MLFNSPYCSMLVKHIPIEDEGLTGRLRDNLATLLKNIDNRICFFEVEEGRAKEREQSLKKVKSAISNAFNTIKSQISAQDASVHRAIDELSGYFENRLHFMGLSEDQESDLMGALDDIKENLLSSLEHTGTINYELETVTRLLNMVD